MPGGAPQAADRPLFSYPHHIRIDSDAEYVSVGQMTVAVASVWRDEVDGRIVGGWYQDGHARVHLQLLEDPGRDGRNALEKRAAELTAWLGGIQIKPRVPSPLSKAVR